MVEHQAHLEMLIVATFAFTNVCLARALSEIRSSAPSKKINPISFYHLSSSSHIFLPPPSSSFFVIVVQMKDLIFIFDKNKIDFGNFCYDGIYGLLPAQNAQNVHMFPFSF